jgi:hypothetical protein
MKTKTLYSLAIAATVFTLASDVHAQVSQQTLDAISAPDKVETRLGTLEYKDGVPTSATVQKAYDNLDFMHAVDVYLNAFAGVSTYAAREGFRSIGVEDNQVVIFPRLMDSKSLFLTANADTVYFLGFLDLSKGPMVLETPPDSLGTLDDLWFNWVIDFGAPGPDRGMGGKYLILPPGYNGPVPEGGFYVARSRTTRVLVLGRSFLEKNDPKPPVELIQRTYKVYPYASGGVGTSIAEILTGKVKPGRNAAQPPVRFVDGSGKSFNTIPPSDFGFYEMLNKLVQEEPADALGDPERMGQLASIGIVKGKPFQPDARMRKILTEAAAVGEATSRTLSFLPRESEGFAVYPGSSWINALWIGGYTMETPPPMVTRAGIVPFPSTGARTLNARTSFFYYATGITPAMIMRLPEIGSQYLMAFQDADKNVFDGAKTYKVTLPPNVPAAKFWSFTLYDNQTRSMLQTAQGYPRAGSQTYPSPAAVPNADGSTTVYFGPTLPAGVQPGNWIQTVPGKGWNTILRLYSPLEPFFLKTWRPSEIELVK